MKSILFIGNSYTYYNRMYDTVVSLCDAAGLKVEMAQVTAGGYTLEKFTDPEIKESTAVKEALESRHWDVCVLQEQSNRPVTYRAAYLNGLERLCPLLKQNTDRQLLYLTWGYKTGNGLLETFCLTTESMAAGLREVAYSAAGKFGFEVSPVGTAFLLCAAQYPELELFTEDCSHPSPEGSYLAACVHMYKAFGISPAGNGFTGAVNPEVAAVLQKIAEQAVSN